MSPSQALAPRIHPPGASEAPSMRYALAALLTLTLACSPGAATTTRVLSGTYQWDNGSDGPLEATFVETGPDSWKVEFVFRFQGKKNKWKGTAQGVLGEGPLEGRAKAARMNRFWVFTAELENGNYIGTHAELVGDEEVPSGTFELSVGSE